MQRIQAITMLSVGFAVAVLLSVFAMPWQVSYSNDSIAQTAEQEQSSNLASIRVTGESSKRIEPDQVTIMMNVQTQPTDFQSIMDKHQATVKKVVDAVRSAAGDNASLKFGQTSLNPYYTGIPSTDSATFVAYATVPVTTDTDNFSEIAGKIAAAGFRVESLSVTPVPANPSEPGIATVTIVPGASEPNNREFYSPQEITVSAGTTVQWFNKDSAGHTVTSGNPGDPDAGSKFDSTKEPAGFLIKPATSWQFTFNNAGGFPYFCQVHPWKTGKVIVTAGGENTETPAESKEVKYQVNMNIVIETQPDTLQNVIKKYQEKFKTLTNTLEELGVPTDTLQQSSVSFNPYYYGPGQYSSYNAYSQIIVKTDMDKADDVANAAQKAGGSLENIFLSISDSALDDARKELNQKALENARSRATEIVEPMGLEIKEVKRIEVNTNPTPNPYGGFFTYKGVGIVPYYDPGVQASGEVYVLVTVEFEIGK